MKLVITIMSLLLLTSAVHAQETTPIRPPSVSAQGEAVITAEPDQAQITSGFSRKPALPRMLPKKTQRSLAVYWRRSRSSSAKATRSKPRVTR